MALPTKGGKPPPRVTSEQWEHFWRLGWVVLPADQVFSSRSELEALQSRIDSIMLGEARVPYDKLMMQLDSSSGSYDDVGAQTLGFKGPTLRYRKIQNLEHDGVIMEYVRKSIFEDACRKIYGDAPIASFRTMFFNKPSRHDDDKAGGTPLPWHQDRWEFLDRDPILNVYLALDPATPESGCVKIVPRSHLGGIVNPSHHSSFLTAEQAERHAPPAQIMDVTLREGEVLLMHNWVIHSSGTNVTERPRRALSINYMDARSKLDTSRFETFQGGELRSTGYPEGGNEFPVIFEAA